MSNMNGHGPTRQLHIHSIGLWTDFGEKCHLVHAFSLGLELAMNTGQDLCRRVEEHDEEGHWTLWVATPLRFTADGGVGYVVNVLRTTDEPCSNMELIVRALVDSIEAGEVTQDTFIVYGPREYFAVHYYDELSEPDLQKVLEDVNNATLNA